MQSKGGSELQDFANCSSFRKCSGRFCIGNLTEKMTWGKSCFPGIHLHFYDINFSYIKTLWSLPKTFFFSTISRNVTRILPTTKDRNIDGCEVFKSNFANEPFISIVVIKSSP